MTKVARIRYMAESNALTKSLGRMVLLTGSASANSGVILLKKCKYKERTVNGNPDSCTFIEKQCGFCKKIVGPYMIRSDYRMVIYHLRAGALSKFQTLADRQIVALKSVESFDCGHGSAMFAGYLA